MAQKCTKCSKRISKGNIPKICKSCDSQPEEYSNSDEEYEVEAIVNDKMENWLGYASAENTWLEEDNLNCPLLLSNYKKLKTKKARGRSEPPLASFLDLCNQNTQDMDEIQTRPYFPENYIIPEPKRLFDEKTPFKDEWIKLLRNSRFNFKVTNTVDLTPPPENFTWIEESVPDIDIPDLDLNKTSGCDCGDTDCIDGNSADCQCLEARGGVSPYDKHGCVRFAPTAMAIYECNIKCACSIYCPNRVTQRIPAFTFDIFRTSNDRGWGVRALEPIRKGKFIARYFGQLITDEEANLKSVFNYMFDIDFFANDGCKYVIDASQMGNIARFFNHSCNPNMATYSVFIDTDDSYRHELAFFTTRAIQAGEELTFDYGGFKGGSRPKSASGNNGLEPCRCGAANCRGTLPLTV